MATFDPEDPSYTASSPMRKVMSEWAYRDVKVIGGVACGAAPRPLAASAADHFSPPVGTGRKLTSASLRAFALP